MFRVDRNAKLTGAQKGRILSLYHDHGHSISEISVLVQATVKYKIRRIATFIFRK